MEPEDRDRLIQLRNEQDVLQDALGKVIKVVSDKIVANQIEITNIRGDSKLNNRIRNGNTEVS
jgi:hypothetical protein